MQEDTVFGIPLLYAASKLIAVGCRLKAAFRPWAADVGDDITKESCALAERDG